MITLTKPIATRDSTTVEFRSGTFNVLRKEAELVFEVGHVDGKFIRDHLVKITFSEDDPNADFTWAQLLSNIPALITAKTEAETAAAGILGSFPGTVS